MDAFQHVNNSVYLTYLEETRDEWFLEVLGNGLLLLDFVLARSAVDFRSPLTQDDGDVDCEVRATRVGTSSVTMAEKSHLRARRPPRGRGRVGGRLHRPRDRQVAADDRRDPHRVQPLAALSLPVSASSIS